MDIKNLTMGITFAHELLNRQTEPLFKPPLAMYQYAASEDLAYIGRMIVEHDRDGEGYKYADLYLSFHQTVIVNGSKDSNKDDPNAALVWVCLVFEDGNYSLISQAIRPFFSEDKSVRYGTPDPKSAGYGLLVNQEIMPSR